MMLTVPAIDHLCVRDSVSLSLGFVTNLVVVTAAKVVVQYGGLCPRCAKVGCFLPPVATGPRVLNSAPPMLF